MILANKTLLGSILFFCFILSWIIIVNKLGIKNKWKEYYNTILFFDLASLIYESVFLFNHPLWAYGQSPYGHTIVKFFNMTITYPCTTILFLHYYPKKIVNQLIHIIKWILIYASIELVFYYIGMFRYYNGWNIEWSMVHGLYQFPLIKLHESHPVLAWVISFPILVIIMVIFKFPFHSLP